jgi:hypothetical protein
LSDNGKKPVIANKNPLRRVRPDSPRPFPLKKRKEKSGGKIEAKIGMGEGSVESRMDSTK